MMDEQRLPMQPPQPPMPQAAPPPPYPTSPPVYPQPLYPPPYPGSPPQPPHVVYVQAPATRSLQWEYLTVVLAGVLSLVGFFFLPFVSGRGLSVTAVQGAMTGGQMLWIIVGAAAVAIVVAGTSGATKPTRGWERMVTGALITVAGMAGSCTVYGFSQIFQTELAQSGTSDLVSLGAGFWLCVIANACLIIGGVLVLVGG
jgi:hypothetical protein